MGTRAIDYVPEVMIRHYVTRTAQVSEITQIMPLIRRLAGAIGVAESGRDFCPGYLAAGGWLAVLAVVPDTVISAG